MEKLSHKITYEKRIKNKILYFYKFFCNYKHYRIIYELGLCMLWVLSFLIGTQGGK
jgi:hypothetical protein